LPQRRGAHRAVAPPTQPGIGQQGAQIRWRAFERRSLPIRRWVFFATLGALAAPLQGRLALAVLGHKRPPSLALSIALTHAFLPRRMTTRGRPGRAKVGCLGPAALAMRGGGGPPPATDAEVRSETARRGAGARWPAGSRSPWGRGRGPR